ncbi:hypothetical protein E4T39_02684 [Aureobasidium subglaciale]|nr:hypothetical protein E4T39_02684 [Aureobasidium subglaciale]
MSGLEASLPRSFQVGHLICTIQDSFPFTIFLLRFLLCTTFCLFFPLSVHFKQAFTSIQITCHASTESLHPKLLHNNLANMVFSQQQTTTSPDPINTTPQPLNLPPSRARNKLAQRLAARAAASASEEPSSSPTPDPDALDASAIAAAFDLPVEPLSNLPDLDLSAVTERQINELIGVNSEGRVVSAYSTSSSDSSSSSSDEESSYTREEQEAAEASHHDTTVMPGVKRRPSTTEAKKRIPLDDEEEEAATSATRTGLQRQSSDPFQSPEHSSGEEEGSSYSSSSSSEEEELMFGRKQRVLGVE